MKTSNHSYRKKHVPSDELLQTEKSATGGISANHPARFGG
jgi:hypothetical protein